MVAHQRAVFVERLRLLLFRFEDRMDALALFHGCTTGSRRSTDLRPGRGRLFKSKIAKGFGLEDCQGQFGYALVGQRIDALLNGGA